jgi:hypothetical protein
MNIIRAQGGATRLMRSWAKQRHTERAYYFEDGWTSIPVEPEAQSLVPATNARMRQRPEAVEGIGRVAENWPWSMAASAVASGGWFI